MTRTADYLDFGCVCIKNTNSFQRVLIYPLYTNRNFEHFICFNVSA